MTVEPIRVSDDAIAGEGGIQGPITDQIDQQAIKIIKQMKNGPQGLWCYEEGSVRQLLKDEIANVLLPTLVLREHVRRRANTEALFDSDDYIDGFLSRRVEIIDRFLGRASSSIGQFLASRGLRPATVRITSLAGDSHNGAQRPLRFSCGEQRDYVLKYSDPRPYQLFATLIEFLSSKTRYRIAYPRIIPSSDNASYFIPYIEPQERRAAAWSSITVTAYNYGVVCALCYVLKAIDVHLENVLVSGEIPIVIDPECLLYDFPEMPQRSRLQSTGIVCWDPNQSALRSGNNPMVHFGKAIRDTGVLTLLSPVGPASNRVIAPDERSIDMKEYRDDVVAGFTDGYRAVLANRATVADLLQSFAEYDFKIRYLCRKTRHYRVIQELLNMPAARNAAETRDYILRKFEQSSGFPRRISRKIVSAERRDLMKGDIPYFWCTSLDNSIRNGDEIVRRGNAISAKERTERVLRNLRETDVDRKIAILKDFLVQDDTPSGGRPEHVETYHAG